MAGGGLSIAAPTLASGFLTGKALIYPLSLVISLFFLWGFSYGLLDVLNKHFQTVLDITKLQSTGLQVVYFGGGYLLFSPVAAEVMKRKGYKVTILMGLSLYSLGAIFFWVSIPYPNLLEGQLLTLDSPLHTSRPTAIVLPPSVASAPALWSSHVDSQLWKQPPIRTPSSLETQLRRLPVCNFASPGMVLHHSSVR
jgi:MFS family permease